MTEKATASKKVDSSVDCHAVQTPLAMTEKATASKKVDSSDTPILLAQKKMDCHATAGAVSRNDDKKWILVGKKGWSQTLRTQ